MLASSVERFGERLRAKRGFNRPSAAVTLEYRRIYILPTAAGIVLGAALLGMLLASMNYKLALGYVLVFLIAGMMFGAMLRTFLNLRRLTLNSGRVAPVFAGEHAAFTVMAIANQEREHMNIHLDYDDADPAQPADIDPGHQHVFELVVPALQRGWLKLERIEISSTYPIGLFRAWSWINLDMRCLVYPKPWSEPVPFPVDESGESSGEKMLDEAEGSKRRGTDDFHGLREYVVGDSLKHVHWKALARGQGMLTKEFTGGADTALWLDVDQAPGTDLEMRLSMVCRWILDASANDMRYGLRVGNKHIEPARGDAQKLRCLEALALHGLRQ